MASSAPVNIATLIESRAGLHGGRPCLAGTGMTVHAIARRYLQGQRAEQMAADLPDIPLSHIHAAIAYYLANRERIDGELTGDQAESDRLFAAWQGERRTETSS
ncbi:MAG: DUF433 domain-containing protein [Dehalococcoidia bacterium]